jgi:hypothetical protein
MCPGYRQRLAGDYLKLDVKLGHVGLALIPVTGCWQSPVSLRTLLTARLTGKRSISSPGTGFKMPGVLRPGCLVPATGK